MKNSIITMMLSVLLLSSCEKILEYPTDDQNRLTVCAVAVTGQSLEVHVSTSLSVDQVPNFYDRGYEAFIRDSRAFYDEYSLVKDATVELSVNGVHTCNLTYHPDSLTYRCDYVPRAGETLTLTITAEGYPQAQCTTTVPKTAVDIKDIDYEVYYDKAASFAEREEANWGLDWDQYGADSIMTISFSFKEPMGEKNYYRLNVRSAGMYISLLSKKPGYTACDVYTSSDPIFYDIDLKKGYGSWPAFFSNVFDDHLIDGKDYRVTVNSRKRLDLETFTIIQLQSISSDLYYFLKAYQAYRVSGSDIYEAPVWIYSNVTNGWGYFGAINNEHTHTIYR